MVNEKDTSKMKEYRYRHIVPEAYIWRFDGDAESLFFADRLLEYVIFNTRPETNPALWQDVEIYVRFRKRDVWRLSSEHIENARHAIIMYRVKYVIEHLAKAEIIEIFNQFYENTKSKFSELFEKKFHAPVDDLFLIQEKHIVTKTGLEKFDEIFDYPGQIEFDDEANDALFDKILNGELTDEQIDYFLGASDDLKDYNKWYKVAKHILATTRNSHTFWTAGDVLGIVLKAVPEDEESQKWLRGQVFEIFWPRVGGVWPILNQDKIDFDADEDSKILGDAIGWLSSLPDLKDRLPELDKGYESAKRKTPEEEFEWSEGFLLGKIHSKDASINEILDQFFGLSDMVYSETHLNRLKQIADKELMPAIRKSEKNANIDKIVPLVNRAIRHAQKYVHDLERERRVMKKLIEKSLR